jgi:DNA repair exonuclease SbcCD ATPase subunit
MTSKLNKLELNLKDSSNQSLDTPETSKREKNKDKDKDTEFDNLIFDRSNEEDEEIKSLQKIYNDKLKEIEKLTNEIKLKDDEISLMNNAKNKFISSGEKKESDFEKSNLSEEELKAELLKLGQEYNDEVQKCTKLHEEKIKNMKDEINQLKTQINAYYNKNEYISKEEHDKILMDLRKKHEQELEPFKKELSELEKFLADNFPNIKNNSNI